MLYGFTHEPQIDYFSTQIAPHNNIPTYSGDLVILAGGIMRSAAELQLPLAI